MIELQRTVFTINREAEFFTEAELRMQICHRRELWPVAILKELVDNALDACESADVKVVPRIEVEIGDDFFSVADNGPGIPPDIVTGSLDYATRTTDKAYYVSPTRGQQGNALKTLWAAPYVFGNAPATIEVAARGVHHTVTVSLDRIANVPKIGHATEAAKVKSGTFWRVGWPDVASYLAGDENPDFYSAKWILAGFSAVNPHAQFVLRHGDSKVFFSHSGNTWKKWAPNRPTSAHWYRLNDFQELIAARVHQAPDGGRGTTLPQFVREFCGMRGSDARKSVVESAGLARQTLADMVAGDDIDRDKVARLLSAMQAEADPVNPERLGIIGKPWFTDRLTELYGAAAESVRYKAIRDFADGLPFVLEVGFGVHRADVNSDGRRVVVGLNWSPAIRNPIDELNDLLSQKQVDEWDDVTLLAHLAYPRMTYTDRGKGELALPDEIKATLAVCICAVADKHEKEKQRAGRQRRLNAAAYERLRKANEPKKVSIKEAAYRVIEAAYKTVSGPNGMPANARQIMYVVRPFVIELTGGRCWKSSNTFTQTLLPNFIRENPETTAGWDVVYDARGHFAEPHTGRIINLGTIGVREYIGGWTDTIWASDVTIEAPVGVRTFGPANRFRFALFVEKEGFGPHLEHARIAERFDVAIMSTKGLSNTASRRLVENLSLAGVTILVLRDFDVAGFSIVHTLRTDTRRYQFAQTPNVIDLGLRLADARRMKLQDEQVNFGQRVKTNPRERLARCGANAKEQSFLVSGGHPGQFTGKRIELNAMTSPQFIDFVESGLRKNGAAEKVMPDDAILDRAYRLLAEGQYIHDHSAELLAEAKKHAKSVELPSDLEKLVKRHLKANPAASWDEALAAIVRRQK